MKLSKLPDDSFGELLTIVSTHVLTLQARLQFAVDYGATALARNLRYDISRAEAIRNLLQSSVETYVEFFDAVADFYQKSEEMEAARLLRSTDGIHDEVYQRHQDNLIEARAVLKHLYADITSRAID